MLVYSFRTFKEQEKLREYFPDVFIFGQLKKDLEIIKQKILKDQPNLILGIANSSDRSKTESRCINSFHEKKINQTGKDFYKLNILEVPDLRINQSPTNSFCNWTMYKISEFLESNNLDSKIGFIHLSPIDIVLLENLRSHYFL